MFAADLLRPGRTQWEIVVGHCDLDTHLHMGSPGAGRDWCILHPDSWPRLATWGGCGRRAQRKSQTLIPEQEARVFRCAIYQARLVVESFVDIHGTWKVTKDALEKRYSKFNTKAAEKPKWGDSVIAVVVLLHQQQQKYPQR